MLAGHFQNKDLGTLTPGQDLVCKAIMEQLDRIWWYAFLDFSPFVPGYLSVYGDGLLSLQFRFISDTEVEVNHCSGLWCQHTTLFNACLPKPVADITSPGPHAVPMSTKDFVQGIKGTADYYSREAVKARLDSPKRINPSVR